MCTEPSEIGFYSQRVKSKLSRDSVGFGGKIWLQSGQSRQKRLRWRKVEVGLILILRMRVPFAQVFWYQTFWREKQPGACTSTVASSQLESLMCIVLR